jgi:N-acetylglucosaminyl-diphospho-decaprenol L-rhamnosyltransferase
MSKNLTIVIVSFNSSKVISTCLEKINFSKYDCVVVDNASTDNTVQLVTDDFPDARIIKLDRNVGFCRGNNAALKHVKTEFAMALNPDAFIFPDDIEKILSLLSNNSDIALAAPLLLTNYPVLENDKKEQLEVVESNLIENCGEFLSVKYIIGAILFLRMSVFNKIGFFDEDIFLYYDDDEISFRAIKNGHKAAILPSALGFHIGHGSSDGSLRVVYRRFWHKALSKFYWKEKQKGKFKAFKSAIRLSFFSLAKCVFFGLIFQASKMVEHFASCLGSLAFIIRLKAFKQDGTPRG